MSYCCYCFCYCCCLSIKGNSCKLLREAGGTLKGHFISYNVSEMQYRYDTLNRLIALLKKVVVQQTLKFFFPNLIMFFRILLILCTMYSKIPGTLPHHQAILANLKNETFAIYIYIYKCIIVASEF